MALEFRINLGGNFVDALEKSNAGLGETEKASKKAAEGIKLFEGELGRMRAGALGINFNAFHEGGRFFTFDLAEGAALAVEGIKKVAEAVYDVGKEMLKAAGAAEDLNLAIKLDVGEKGAEEVNALAESFRGTRFDDKLIKSSLLPILEESGLEHSDQWNDLVTAATDVATRRNTGSAGAKAALEALRGIEIQPQKLRGSLKELGIKQKDFYEDLGNLMGISAETAEKQTKAGQVKAQTLLSVALNQIAAREGGSLGNATNQGEKTLGSTLERLGNLKENMFEQLAGSRGLQAVQGFLTNFIDTMEGPIGTELVQKISGAFETLFGDLSGPEGLTKVQTAIGAVADKVVALIDGFKEAWPAISAGVSRLVPVFETFASLVSSTVGMLAKAAELAEQFADYVADNESGTVGKKKAGGGTYTLDERDREQLLERAGKAGFFHELFTSNDTLAQEAFAQAEAEGSIPKFARGGIVSGPTLALIGEAGPEAVVPLDRRSGSTDFSGLSSGGPPSFTGNVAVTVNVNGAIADTSAAEIGQEAGQAVRVELERFLREAQSTFGG